MRSKRVWIPYLSTRLRHILFSPPRNGFHEASLRFDVSIITMPSSALAFVGFVLVAIAATWGIFGLQWYNGFIELHHTFDATESLPVRLPGSDIPAMTRFTGFQGLDEYLLTMVRFFVPGAFGESHALSLFSTYFLGQIIPLHTFLLQESLKAGNAGSIIS
jgi:hypothetical protein